MLNADYITDSFAANKVSETAINEFDAHIKKRLAEEDFVKTKTINNSVMSLISGFDFEKLYISYTTSHSIFYRFRATNNPSYEFKWEVFIDEDEDCDFEAILHIYKDSIDTKSTFGSIDYTFNTITETLFANETSETDGFVFFDEYQADAYTLEYA